MRGRFNVSKLPRDYSSCVCTLCVCVGYFYSSLQRVEGGRVSLLLLFVLLTLVPRLTFLNAALSSPSWVDQHWYSSTRIVRWACCSAQENSLCLPVPLSGLNNIIFIFIIWLHHRVPCSLCTEEMKVNRDCFLSLSLSVFLWLFLSHSDAHVAVMITPAQHTWEIVMKYLTKHELFTWDLSLMCRLPLPMPSHYWDVWNQSHQHHTPPPSARAPTRTHPHAHKVNLSLLSYREISPASPAVRTELISKAFIVSKKGFTLHVQLVLHRTMFLLQALYEDSSILRRTVQYFDHIVCSWSLLCAFHYSWIW